MLFLKYTTINSYYNITCIHYLSLVIMCIRHSFPVTTEIGGITLCSADKGISGVSGAAEAGLPELEGEEGGTTFCDAGVNGAAVAFNSGAAAFGDASC